MAVARPVRRGGRWQLTHSDHFSMLLSLVNLQKARQNEKREKEVRWNLSKKNGWERYKQLTEANCDKIANLVQDEELDIERLMTKIEGIENKIKFKAFGETKGQQERKLLSWSKMPRQGSGRGKPLAIWAS